LLAKETVLLRDGQVHAGIGHVGHLLDRAGQFALQAALEVHALGELRLADGGLVHQLETGSRTRGAACAALGQALRGQLHAQLVDLAGRHEDGAARLMLVGHVHGRQLADDLAPVLVGQAAVQRPVVALSRPQRDGQHGAGQRQQAGAHRQLAAQG